MEKPVEKIVEKIVEKSADNNGETKATKYKFLNLWISKAIKFEIGKGQPDNNEVNEEEQEEEEQDVNIIQVESKEENDKNDTINNNTVTKENENKEGGETNNNNVETAGNLQSGLDLKKTMIGIDSFEVFTNESVNQLINGDIDENDVKTIKEIESEKRAIINEVSELEKQSDIEVYNQTCLQKIKELKKKINILRTKKDVIKKELSVFTEKEINLLELLSPKGDKIFIFNPFLNEVEEILIPENYTFPKNFSYINIPPYCYISGGVRPDEREEMEELRDFYAIRRKGPKEFDLVRLPEMTESKSNHCMVELKYLNGLGVIGGNETKFCDVYDFKENIWESLPDLNKIRENPCCCVLNEKKLFCFFGYDNKAYKFNPTIETLDLEILEKWDLITPTGQQIHMKRKCASCLNYNLIGKDIIVIVGGINTLQSESNDYLIYDEKENKIQRKNNVLPFKCSFKQNNFNFLSTGYFCNFTVDSLIIQYEQGGIFFGIKESI